MFCIFQTSGGNSQLVQETDDHWNHELYQLISDNQDGPANDHVLQLNAADGTVSCDGFTDDANSKKIQLSA